MREVFLGNRRFDEMVRKTGAPRDTLAARLRTLVGAGILERRPYSERPARYEYRLTEAGRDLYPVIVALMRWGDVHLAGDDGPPVVLEHRCGHRLVTQLVCEACGEPVDPRDTRPLAARRLTPAVRGARTVTTPAGRARTGQSSLLPDHRGPGRARLQLGGEAMPEESFVPLPGSTRRPLPGGRAGRARRRVGAHRGHAGDQAARRAAAHRLRRARPDDPG